jgi:hypothetical protein
MPTRKYLMPMARNTTTGQTVKIQDMDGLRYTQEQKFLCEQRAEKLAETMTQRTGDSWIPIIKEYVPSVRKI